MKNLPAEITAGRKHKFKEEKHMMKILAKPVNQVLILNPEKAEEFLNRKPDPKVRERILRNAEKLRLQRERSKK